MIFRIYIEDQNKVIGIKDLRIFEDILTKAFSAQPNFNEKRTFDATQIPDKQDLFVKSSVSEEKKVKPKPLQKPRKTQVDRYISTRESEEENELKTTKKLTKSRVERILKLMPKR